jgi:hypothetical protein
MAWVVRSVNRHVFAEYVAFTNDQPGRFPPVSEILRRLSDHTSGVKLVLLANSCNACEVGMRTNYAARTYSNIAVDYGVGTNPNGRIQFGLRVNDCSRVNHVKQIAGRLSIAKPKSSIRCGRHQSRRFGNRFWFLGATGSAFCWFVPALCE